MHWCLLSIVGVTIVGAIVRYLCRKVTSNSTVIAHVDEFIGNLFSGVFVMELGVISKLHGRYSVPLLIAGYVHLFFKFLYFGRLGGGFMNPLSFIASYYRDGRRIRFSMFFAASIVVTQFVALIASQKLALMIWAFEDESHVDAMQVACTTSMSLTHPWYHVAMYEAFGVVVGSIIDLSTPDKLKEITGAFVTMSLYVGLTHISGSFFNPIIATAFSFRCAGHTSDWEHLAVYWIAPALGMMLAWEFWLGMTKFMRKSNKVE